MRIGILGTGNMAWALGGRWERAGHEVRCGGRGAFAEAAAFGEVVLVAVPSQAALDVVAAAGPLDGRVLIDCSNPLVPGRVALHTAGGPSMAERIAAAAPGARVVKAFNLASSEVWRSAPPEVDGVPLGVPVCGDDPAAVATVGRLVEDLGCAPVPGGGLDRAGLLEATAAYLIGLWFAGVDARTVVPPLASDDARPTLNARPGDGSGRPAAARRDRP
ncbi:NADPH-dependent F420 reductase [Streptomyces mayteni]